MISYLNVSVLSTDTTVFVRLTPIVTVKFYVSIGKSFQIVVSTATYAVLTCFLALVRTRPHYARDGDF